MLGRKLKGLASLQDYDFDKKIRSEQLAEVKLKLLGLSHIRDGKQCKEVAAIVKQNANTVREWINCFAQKGYEGLKRQP